MATKGEGTFKDLHEQGEIGPDGQMELKPDFEVEDETDEQKRQQSKTTAVAKRDLIERANAAQERGEDLGGPEIEPLSEDEQALVEEFDAEKEAQAQQKKEEEEQIATLVESLSTVDNAEALAGIEDQELAEYLGGMESEANQKYDALVGGAIDELLEEQAKLDPEYKLGVKELESSAQSEGHYEVEDHVEELIDEAVKNPIIASRLVNDAQKMAIDMMFNGQTGDGTPMIDRVGPQNAFRSVLEAIPVDQPDQRKEMFGLLEETANEAEEDRKKSANRLLAGTKLGQKGPDVATDPLLNEKPTMPYRKKTAEDLLEEKALDPTNEDIAFVDGLLEDAKISLNAVAEADGDVGVFTRNKKEKQAAAERETKQANVIAAHQAILRRYALSHTGTARSIDNSPAAVKKRDMVGRMRKLQMAGE